MSPRVPAVGRIVHYVSLGTPVREDGSQAYRSECRAAVITEVGEWPEGTSVDDHANIAVPVSLTMLSPNGWFCAAGVMQSELGRQGGTWHWPESPDGTG